MKKATALCSVHSDSHALYTATALHARPPVATTHAGEIKHIDAMHPRQAQPKEEKTGNNALTNAPEDAKLLSRENVRDTPRLGIWQGHHFGCTGAEEMRCHTSVKPLCTAPPASP